MLLLARLIAGSGIVLFAWGCSTPPEAQTPDDERYLFLVDATPLEFTVPLAELDVAIDRTVEWLVEYGGLEASEGDRVAFKELVRVHETGIIAGPLQYQVSNLGSQGYGVAFALEHDGGFGLGEAVARNAHILAPLHPDRRADPAPDRDLSDRTLAWRDHPPPMPSGADKGRVRPRSPTVRASLRTMPRGALFSALSTQRIDTSSPFVTAQCREAAGSCTRAWKYSVVGISVGGTVKG
jgi:hypothetical protein